VKKIAGAIALTAATLPLIGAPALALEPLDARAMGLAGHYSAYANSDVNGTLLNPALLGKQRGLFYIGPNLGAGMGLNTPLGTDLMSVQSNLSDVSSYLSYLVNYTTYAQGLLTGSSTAELPQAPGELPALLKSLNADGLGTELGLRTGAFGLRLPIPSFLGVRNPAPGNSKARDGGPAMGSLGLRSWVDADLNLNVSAPQVFSVLTQFPTLDQNLKESVSNLFQTFSGANSISPSSLQAPINHIRDTLKDPNGFGMFMANGAEDTGERSVNIKLTNKIYSTTALTLTQPVPMPSLPFFDKPRASIGAAYKVFNSLGQLSNDQNFLPKSASGSALPIGMPGSLELAANVNLNSKLSQLDEVLAQFATDPTKITDLKGKFEDMGKADFTKSITLDATSRVASAMGMGGDLGAQVDLNDQLSVGACLSNVAVFWPGTEVRQKATLGENNTASWTEVAAPQSINFTDTEPMALSLGAAYKLPMGFTVMGDFGQAFNGSGPSLRGGVEWSFFNLLYLRGGARVGGEAPMYGVGAGLNLMITKLDASLGLDPQFKAASVAVSWGVGF